MLLRLPAEFYSCIQSKEDPMFLTTSCQTCGHNPDQTGSCHLQLQTKTWSPKCATPFTPTLIWSSLRVAVALKAKLSALFFFLSSARFCCKTMYIFNIYINVLESRIAEISSQTEIEWMICKGFKYEINFREKCSFLLQKILCSKCTTKPRCFLLSGYREQVLILCCDSTVLANTFTVFGYHFVFSFSATDKYLEKRNYECSVLF